MYSMVPMIKMKDAVLMKIPKMLFFLYLAGCASIHPGSKGEMISSKKKLELVVSVDKNDKLSDEVFSFLTFTFENEGNRWIRINKARFKFKDTNKKSRVIVGDDLKTWAKGLENRLKKSDYNTNMALSGLILGGFLAAISSKPGSAGSAVGTAAIVGGTVVAAAKGIRDDITRLETPKAVPKEHLHHPKFSIAPKQFIRKWIVIQIPEDEFQDDLLLSLKTLDGGKVDYKIEL